MFGKVMRALELVAGDLELHCHTAESGSFRL